MINKDLIIKLVQDYITDKNIFLVDVKIGTSNTIKVLVDTFEGISINQCIELSREIESKLDRDKEDFELEVSSPGLTEPFKVYQQYQKNIQRILAVTLNDNSRIKGKLISVENNIVELEVENKVIVEGKKKKKLVKAIQKLNIDDIKTTKIVISF